MEEPIRINDDVYVGGQPNESELRQLAEQGIRSIVNLRQPGEDEEQVEPDREATIAHSLGMQYAHIPVSSDDLNDTKVDRFRRIFEELEKPVLVHCRSGKRSGAFTMMHVGANEDMSGDAVLEKAADMGFECDSEKLEAFVRRYVNEKNGRSPKAS